MSKQVYRIKGDFQMGRLRQTFSVEVVGTDEASARERVLTDFGSRHGVSRREITIASVKVVPTADVHSAIAARRAQA